MLAGRDVLTLVPISEPGRSRVFYEEILGLPFVADDSFALVENKGRPAGKTTSILIDAMTAGPANLTAERWPPRSVQPAS